MESWYVQTKPVFYNGFENDEFQDYALEGFCEALTDTPLGSNITLCKGSYDNELNLFETEVEALGIVQSNAPDTITKAWERQLLVPIGTMLDYKYVRVNGDIWLIMAKPSNNKIYEKVVLYLCNYIAKWQDNDGNIIYKPFFISNASQYNSGEVETKTVTIGYNQLLIYTSLDNETVNFNREKRLFIDYNTSNPLPYKTTRIDTVSYSFGESRVLSLIMTEDQYNPETDSINLMLCDYISPISTPIVSPISITYTGQAQIRNGGSAKTFTAETDNEITNWSKVCTSEIEDYIVLIPDTTNNKKCKVKCLNNENLIGSSFRLQCTDGINTSEVEIMIGGVV